MSREEILHGRRLFVRTGERPAAPLNELRAVEAWRRLFPEPGFPAASLASLTRAQRRDRPSLFVVVHSCRVLGQGGSTPEKGDNAKERETTAERETRARL